MATEVLMPSMGEGVAEANLVNWLKKVGETVNAGEPLLLVSTDKVDTEIPAPATGVLTSLNATEGQVVKVNDVLAIIGGNGESTAKAPAKNTAGPETKAAPQPAKVAASHNLNTPDGGKVRSSPLVRKMAKEHDIALTSIAGSGLNGRITKRDLETALTRGPQVATSQTSAVALTKVPQVSETGHRLKTTVANGQEFLDGVPVERKTMSRMRQLIADHMVDSVRTSPHVTTVFEIDLHKVVQIREAHKKSFAAREGFGLTYTPFLIEASVSAIKQHPIVNVSVDGYDVLYKNDINVGCAVALENGLIVPVIKKAGELNLLGIARRLNDLVTRARSKKLLPDEVQGGTFSITNPGGFGSIVSNPIINQPQVAILSIGAIVKRPVVVDDMIAIRPMCMIGLTFDHRVIDGEGGAKYLATLKNILENYTATPE